jgi:hypothetical protein
MHAPYFRHEVLQPIDGDLGRAIAKSQGGRFSLCRSGAGENARKAARGKERRVGICISEKSWAMRGTGKGEEQKHALQIAGGHSPEGDSKR